MNVPPLPEAPEDSSAATPAPQAKRPARLLPRPRMGGLMPWVIAILIALVVIAASGGLVLRNLADNARADLAAAVTVQVIEPNPDLRAARGKAVVGVLQDMELVRAVRLVPESELAALLEPWLGTVLREAAFGAAVGTALGLGAIWLLSQQFAALDSGMAGGGGLGPADWVVIAAVPVIGVLLALATARMTIALALKGML